MGTYAEWRVGKDRHRVGDPPRLRITQRAPRTPNGDEHGKPWCEACDEGFRDECYCTGCKGSNPTTRGRYGGCYCWLNRRMAGEVTGQSNPAVVLVEAAAPCTNHMMVFIGVSNQGSHMRCRVCGFQVLVPS